MLPSIPPWHLPTGQAPHTGRDVILGSGRRRSLLSLGLGGVGSPLSPFQPHPHLKLLLAVDLTTSPNPDILLHPPHCPKIPAGDSQARES